MKKHYERNEVRNEKRNKKVIKAALIVFLVILFLMSAALLCLFVKVKGEKKNIVNVPIDLSQVRDGEYEGHSETTLVKVDVKVVVEGENIQNIQLIRHVCGKGEPANAMLDTMIQENTYDVDTVSGATMSSKVIKNAVNDALQKGLE